MGIPARDLMQKEVGVIEASASLAQLERDLDGAGVGGLPVVESGRLVGVVSRADVIRRLVAGAASGARAAGFYSEQGGDEARELLATFAQVAARSGTRLEDLRVSDVMSRSIVAVSPDHDVVDVARAFSAHRVHRVLVVEGTTLVGLISSLDLVRLVAEGRLTPARG